MISSEFKNIEGILLDVGDTLSKPTSGHWFITPNFKSILIKYGIPHPERENLHQAIAVSMEYLENNHYVITEQEEFNQFKKFYRIVLNQLGISNLSNSALEELADDMVYNDDKFVLFPDVYHEIEYLFNRGFILGILSDTWPSMERIFINHDLRRFFKAFIISSKIGCYKPQKQIFRHAINEISLPANKLIFIDDALENIKAAKQIGLHALLIDRYGNCESKSDPCIRDLRELRKLLS